MSVFIEYKYFLSLRNDISQTSFSILESLVHIKFHSLAIGSILLLSSFLCSLSGTA